MTSTPMRTCASCRAEVAAESVRCSRCSDWRADVKADRNMCYVWSIVASIPIFILAYGMVNGWWPPPRGRGSLAQMLFAPAFSTHTFLSSTSGLLVVGGILVPLALATRSYVAYSRKTGSWFWL